VFDRGKRQKGENIANSIFLLEANSLSLNIELQSLPDWHGYLSSREHVGFVLHITYSGAAGGFQTNNDRAAIVF